MIWRELAPEELYELRAPLIIDVRSPSEFAAEKIPGALNVPLLLDNERSEIGCIYQRDGEIVARRHALTFISHKVPAIIDEMVRTKRSGQPLVVYCWRGGLRSEAVASLLSIAGISCSRLTGGFKAWRKMVISDLAADRFPFEPIVLHGMTGTGKTEILGELSRLGCQVLDLESLANHRGSTFGGMGLGRQPGQKDFESVLWCSLRDFNATPVFLEAESRKIGRLSLPDCILRRIRSGRAVLVHGDLDNRSARLAKDYMHHHPGNNEDLSEGLKLLEQLRQYISKKIAEEIFAMAVARDIEAAIKLLLIEYYDPLYQQSMKCRGSFDLEVCGNDTAAAARQLATRFQQKPVSM